MGPFRHRKHAHERRARARLCQLIKPILFLAKVPMVYGTVISNAIVFGAIVSVSAMLSGSGPQARAVRLRPRLGRSQDLAVHPCFKDKEHCQLPLVNLLERLTRCSWASCCMLIVVRVVKRVLSAVYSEKSPLFITPIF